MESLTNPKYSRRVIGELCFNTVINNISKSELMFYIVLSGLFLQSQIGSWTHVFPFNQGQDVRLGLR